MFRLKYSKYQYRNIKGLNLLQLSVVSMKGKLIMIDSEFIKLFLRYVSLLTIVPIFNDELQ